AYNDLQRITTVPVSTVLLLQVQHNTEKNGCQDGNCLLPHKNSFGHAANPLARPPQQAFCRKMTKKQYDLLQSLRTRVKGAGCSRSEPLSVGQKKAAALITQSRRWTIWHERPKWTRVPMLSIIVKQNW